MTVIVAVVCEAPADQRTGCGLADRLITTHVDWISRDNISKYRQWVGVSDATKFIPWKSIPIEVRTRNIKIHGGKFNDIPGAPDAHAARRALLLLKGIYEKTLDAIILLRDNDGDTQRRVGLEQARDRMQGKWDIPIVIGVAHVKRECWALAGFEPKDEKEQAAVERERSKLGFDPRLSPERLRAREKSEDRSPNRVLRKLTGGDTGREAACWEDTPLKTLTKQGRNTGLPQYLRDVCRVLLSLFTHVPPDECDEYQ